MVDKISQNLKYSEGAVLMCWENALSLCERDNKKYTFSMQLTDYQAFTPPPHHQLLDKQAVTHSLSGAIKNYQLQIKSKIALCLFVTEDIMRNILIIRKLNKKK